MQKASRHKCQMGCKLTRWAWSFFLCKVRRPAKHTRDNRETPMGYTSDNVNINTDGNSNDTYVIE